ncbi:hypothetical protein N7E81_08300 [Reichenbachiella carrageenanivorans]|uniref:DUF1735 domain-containing protein n=1 Tax=Reichenbachiella carrageenanivorans TaxID=2979869 RepID=A0ABY6D4M0_9BACT|nr:hypothetical protein [Reichenbachiella carrageenanivorans]UXX81100.1 hypothetical protein N7E81_08300 [Reichenbachiella carrageenanivorans]
MKNLLFALGLLAVVASSCDEKVWPMSELELVPVYSVTEIVGTDAPFALEVYKEKSLAITFVKQDLLESTETYDYIDASDEVNYGFTFSAKEEILLEDSTTTIHTLDYEISADKATGVGSMTITTTEEDATVTTLVYTAEVAEEERYN